VAAAYGVLTGPGGVARRWTFYIGKDGKILYIDTQVNAGRAGEDIAARLAALGVAKKAK
jgi:peroxiredoxin Q/BCP